MSRYKLIEERSSGGAHIFIFNGFRLQPFTKLVYKDD